MEERLDSHISLKKWKRIFPYVKKIKVPAVLVLVFMLISALSESIYPMFTNFAVNSFVVPGTTEGIFCGICLRHTCWGRRGYNILSQRDNCGDAAW